ncbi:MAG: RNA polymerase sigma factor [Fibrobacterota bacterium]
MSGPGLKARAFVLEETDSERTNTVETDEQLIQRSLEGDRKAVEKLVDIHQGFIYNVALKFFNNLDDARDATQEVLLKAISHLSSYDAAKGAFRTWLYRITFHHFLNAKQNAYEKNITGFPVFYDLHEWMHRRCGLVNLDNPCRCPKKTKGFIAKGWVNPQNRKWHSGTHDKIRRIVESRMEDVLVARDRLYNDIYKEHTYKQPTVDANALLEGILKDPTFHGVFSLGTNSQESTG